MSDPDRLAGKAEHRPARVTGFIKDYSDEDEKWHGGVNKVTTGLKSLLGWFRSFDWSDNER
jgi:hypothetical protein